ncbi:MAG TPA: hypothetical protein VL978_14580 [Puia sp.]|nr:hypothetical protein [Puia sp.]
MNNDRYSIFFKAMMTGLFVGIIDTVICLGYNIGYRNYTGYLPSSLINVSSLIFAVNLLMLIIGIIFFLFLSTFKRGDLIFGLAAIAVTAWLIWKTATLTRFGDPKLDSGFRGLLGGILLILGASTASIPLLYRSQRFVDAVI